MGRKNFISSKSFTCKKDKNKAGMRKLKHTTLLQNDGALLSGLQRNALASVVHFVVCTSASLNTTIRFQLTFHNSPSFCSQCCKVLVFVSVFASVFSAPLCLVLSSPHPCPLFSGTRKCTDVHCINNNNNNNNNMPRCCTCNCADAACKTCGRAWVGRPCFHVSHRRNGLVVM